MSKIIPLVLIIFALGAAFYFLPQLAPFGFFGASADPASEVVVISLNGGRSFEKTAFPETAVLPDIFEITQSLDKPAVFYAATSRGLFSSRNWGITWRKVETAPLGGAAVYKIAENARKPGEFYVSSLSGGRAAVYRTGDGFLSLESVFEENGQKITGLTFSGERIVFGLSDGRILSYSPSEKSFRVLAKLNSRLSGLVSDQSSGVLFALTGEGVFAAFDGRTFKKIKSGEAKALSARGGTVYLLSGDEVFKSTDGGLNWTPFTTLASPRTPFNNVFLGDGDSLYLASDKSLYRSVNSGVTWRILLSLRSSRAIGAIFVSGDGKIVAVGTGSKSLSLWSF